MSALATIEIKDVNESTALELKNQFTGLFDMANEWAAKGKAIVVTDSGQKEEMLLAREARIELKNIRVDVEKKRKSMKDESLRKGRAVDGVANIIKYLIVPVEDHLREQEEFVKRIEDARIKTLVAERSEKLREYQADPTFYVLGTMPDEEFDRLSTSHKAGYDLRKENERKAESERLEADHKEEQEHDARIKAESEERERIEEDNERLRAEAEKIARENEIQRRKQEKINADIIEAEKKTRAAYEAKLEKERQERIAIQAEANKIAAKERAKREAAESALKQKQDDDARLAAQKAERERQAALAPDREKLLAYSKTIIDMQPPHVESVEACNILSEANDMLERVVVYIHDECQKL